MDITNEDSVHIAEHLINLKEIKVRSTKLNGIGILELLTKAPHLTKASFEMLWLEESGPIWIDQGIVDSVAEVCTNRNIAIIVELCTADTFEIFPVSAWNFIDFCPELIQE